jgi:hypothetical protein
MLAIVRVCGREKSRAVITFLPGGAVEHELRQTA